MAVGQEPGAIVMMVGKCALGFMRPYAEARAGESRCYPQVLLANQRAAAVRGLRPR